MSKSLSDCIEQTIGMLEFAEPSDTEGDVKHLDVCVKHLSTPAAARVLTEVQRRRAKAVLARVRHHMLRAQKEFDTLAPILERLDKDLEDDYDFGAP